MRPDPAMSARGRFGGLESGRAYRVSGIADAAPDCITPFYFAFSGFTFGGGPISLNCKAQPGCFSFPPGHIACMNIAFPSSCEPQRLKIGG
ncbi:hypothetical protein GON01_10480 [Sphingomonas sp. MAH-20]|uniref:Uncharacterized protein n=2 Tax=Sphingomonas TaxID=13687 RepID=A0A6I4J214_9SPHN|nr:hypothetical protein [Sphingomonas horti]MVO78356.1 hypothetical protein [Sphingomonas horti]